jgi:hypothetical protein
MARTPRNLAVAGAIAATALAQVEPISTVVETEKNVETTEEARKPYQDTRPSRPADRLTSSRRAQKYRETRIFPAHYRLQERNFALARPGGAARAAIADAVLAYRGDRGGCMFEHTA